MGHLITQTAFGGGLWCIRPRNVCSVCTLLNEIEGPAKRMLLNHCRTVWKLCWTVALPNTRLTDNGDAITPEKKAAAFHGFFHHLISHSFLSFVGRPRAWRVWNSPYRYMREDSLDISTWNINAAGDRCNKCAWHPSSCGNGVRNPITVKAVTGDLFTSITTGVNGYAFRLSPCDQITRDRC